MRALPADLTWIKSKQRADRRTPREARTMPRPRAQVKQLFLRSLFAPRPYAYIGKQPSHPGIHHIWIAAPLRALQ
ncbi:MAG: hypothetical protein LBF50_03445 [Azoarcus sp.]|nr:hypothetical protein [Azoarcus sp.]